MYCNQTHIQQRLFAKLYLIYICAFPTFARYFSSDKIRQSDAGDQGWHAAVRVSPWPWNYEPHPPVTTAGDDPRSAGTLLRATDARSQAHKIISLAIIIVCL